MDRVLLNDASAPLAIRQFREMGATRIAAPQKVAMVCDHFAPAPTIQAEKNFNQMRSFAAEHDVADFFDVGKGGIEHTLLPEKGLIAPGDLIVGGDSHTCTSGAFGALGTGMGATDIAAALALDEVWLMVPRSVRVELKGTKNPYVTGKDIILEVLRVIGTAGAVYECLEFGGDGIQAFNPDERMAICNMAVEAGAKTGIVEADEVTEKWAEEHVSSRGELLRADSDAEYESRIVIDLEKLAPLVAQPHSPDRVVPVAEGSGVHVDQVYIGNCANGTMTDLRQAVSILRGNSVSKGTRLIVVPATQEIYRQALAEGLLDAIVEAGGAVSTPACGGCFGGYIGLLDGGEVAVATTNRNFHGRMGHPDARIYLANAYVAAASAVAGELVEPASIVNRSKRAKVAK